MASTTTSSSAAPTVPDAVIKQRVRQSVTTEDWLIRGLIVLAGLWLLVIIFLPLYSIIYRSLTDKAGNLIWFANYATYFQNPALYGSLYNSIFIATVSTIISVLIGFLFSYAVTRTAMVGKPIFRRIVMLPLYMPSLIHAIALIYLFGNQGFVTKGFFGYFRENWGFDPSFDIGLYGPIGIIIGEVLFCFPQAIIILIVALSLTDARLYEASTALRASRIRTFFTVTVPSIKYGLISAAFVCFTLAFTDFGIPKVVGGDFNVLATDIYKQVIGQQNFQMGATVSILLLVPTVIAFAVDRIVQRRQMSLVNARAVPLHPQPNPLLDGVMLLFCMIITLIVLAMLGTAIFASLVNVWPYDFTLTLKHYDFGRVGGGGFNAYWNSVRMSAYTAVFGTVILFFSAYLIEKGKQLQWTRSIIYFISILPVALPGMVIGLAYIFFFNQPSWDMAGLTIPNPFNVLYGTMTILVIANIVHYYTVPFLTATTALKQMDPEFESVSASMSVPFYKTFWRVTLPVCLPAVLEIAMYYFVSAMVTVSAVIFLYAPSLKLASVAVVNMDDAGDTAAAAAMSVFIIVTSIGVRVLYELVTWGITRQTQAWKKR
ncbi:MAG: putative 2-aminoethylphosphonate ABC transporter permease subunit [Chloroflexaceae bacterium]|nr:putative 2-aminoethylphosphonate ABC transporter permease subunit [Chloroflexaceae bacterium]